MKKYLVIFGAAVLVMALAAPAMAQFSSWGHMEIQTIWEQKPNFNTQNNTNGGWINNTSTVAGAGNGKDVNWRHVAERFRYYLQYGDPKTVRAVIGFEADSKDWGESTSASSFSGGGMGRYTADTVQLEIKHAYLDFMIPNTPVQVTAGVQDWAYGGRLLINNDGAGIKVKANFAPHTLTAGWLRFSDTHRYDYLVTDGYFLDWKMVQKTFDVNVYGVFVNDRAEGQSGATSPTVGLSALRLPQIHRRFTRHGAEPRQLDFLRPRLWAGGSSTWGYRTGAYAREGWPSTRSVPGQPW
jgi:hypothetical protein